jgi:hypothetical protein
MKTRWLWSCLIGLAGMSLAAPVPALACGGGDSYWLHQPIQPAATHVEGWLYNDFYWGEDGPEGVSRFLHVARALDVEGMESLESALDGVPYNPELDMPGPSSLIPVMTAALSDGNVRSAEEIAWRIVEEVADLPVPLAERHVDALRLAVELIEVRPLLKKVPPAAAVEYFSSIDGKAPRPLQLASEVRGTSPSVDLKVPAKHPRAASLAWLQLRGEFAALPDGWSADDMRSAAPGAAEALQPKVDAWLSKYPKHPLRPWAELKKVRLHYLAGESDAAWAILLRMHRAHPARVTNEMRFLVRQGVLPSAVVWADLPIEIAGGLLTEVAFDEADWNMLWLKTQQDPNAAWAVALQERLLLAAMRDLQVGRPLPREFPKAPGAPTVAWGRLRVSALVDAGYTSEAEAQIAAMPGEDEFLAPIRARLAIERGDWAAAIRTPQLDVGARRYLIRVIAPEPALVGLIDDQDDMIALESRLSLATRRLASTGNWDQGADLLSQADPDRAQLWREAGLLARNTSVSGRLAFARFMGKAAGRIFLQAGGDEMVWYRSLPHSGPPEPTPEAKVSIRNWPTPEEEWVLTEQFLKRNFATWMAFEAYSQWLMALDLRTLSRPTAATQANQVLAEADQAYNNLINYGSGDYYAWGHIAGSSEAARNVRGVGRVIHANP